MARTVNTSQYISIPLGFCLAWLLVGCNWEAEPDGLDTNTPVTFAADVNTRGTTATSATVKQLGVFAYYTGQAAFADGSEFTPNFMYNQLATKTDGAWGYSPLKYWPNTASEKISFFAYYPYDDGTEGNLITVKSDNDQKGYPQLEYTLPTSITDQVDVLTASSPDLTYTIEGVKFTMNHALTRIRFSAKRVEDLNKHLTSLIVTKITLMGVYADGIATLTPDSVKWTIPVQAQAKEFVLTPDAGLETVELNDAAFLNLTSEGYDMMLIPQLIEDMVLAVEMEVTTETNQYSKTASFALRELPRWRWGKTINYQFTLNWNTISELSANIIDWKKESVSNDGNEQIIQ